MTTENQFVAKNAVIKNALPLDQMALIGVMSAGETETALIRMAAGDIAKVSKGDVVGSQVVAAISDDSLILAAPNGTQTRLQMPS